MTDKGRFLKIFTNLPVNLRNEIIAVLPDVGPVTWSVAYLEVSNDTKLAKKILEKLSYFKII